MATTTCLATEQAPTGRRNVLRGFAAASAIAGLAAPRLARGEIAGRVLKMGHASSSDSPLGIGGKEFSRQVEAATGGAYHIKHYASGALGGEVELLDGLRRGEVDLAFISAVALSGALPAFGVFDLPFLFRDAVHARAVLDSPIGLDYLTQFRERDLIGLAWGEIGLRHITNSKHPVREPADLHGLRMRVPQSDIILRSFRQLGTDAMLLGFPALYGALESGRFDGQENPIGIICAGMFQRVQKYLTLSGHVYSSAILFMSKDLWDDLRPAERDIFAAAAQSGGIVSRKAAGQAERDGIEVLRRAGMEVVPGVDRTSFLGGLKLKWSDLARRFGEERIEQVRSFDA